MDSRQDELTPLEKIGPDGASSPRAGLVSVVMPAYRAERHIAETLESVRRQTYPHWELIVVDDASPDRTEDVVREFAARLSGHRVAWERNEANRGPSHSRNRAIGLARGEFFAFLDADDLWLEGYLEASLRALEESEADIVYSSAVMFEDATRVLLGVWGPTPRDLERFPEGLLSRPYILPSAAVVRRSVFERVGLFDSSLRGAEDLDLWLRCAAAGLKFVYLGGCRCLYRKGRSEAFSSNFASCTAWIVRALRKNQGLVSAIPPRTWRKHTAKVLALGGRHELAANPRQSRRLFFDAWRTTPVRIDFLGLAALACMPPVVRMLKRLYQAHV